MGPESGTAIPDISNGLKIRMIVQPFSLQNVNFVVGFSFHHFGIHENYTMRINFCEN